MKWMIPNFTYFFTVRASVAPTCGWFKKVIEIAVKFIVWIITIRRFIYSFMMSFGNYNVRHSNLTSRESFSTYSKQQNSSMMYRGSQFSDVSFVIRSLYSTGTRTATPSSRTATRMARAKNITSETSISRYPKFGSRPCTSNLKPILQPCNHGVV